MFTSVLSQEQIHQIHEASLTILECVGVEIPHPKILSRFADSGSQVDFKTKRVRIRADVVVGALKQAGKKFTLYGRDLGCQAAFGEGKRNYNTSGGQAFWLDGPGEERRTGTLADTAAAARLSDGLKYINVVGAMADPPELPNCSRPLEIMATLIRNTTKPIHFWLSNRAAAKYVVDMLIALRGDEERASTYPICYPFLEPISPLRFPFEGIDMLFETSRLNMPTPVGPMAQMGLSAPATIAATLAQENAEILAGICVTQLVRAGTPVMYGGICHAFDMSTTQCIFSGPEQAIFGVAMTQMGKHYGLPVYVNVGLTDSKRVDAQAGLEVGTTLATSVAAGADIFGHMGICGADQSASLDILLMQHEVISFIESTQREIEFSEETFGLGEIAAVAGTGKTFLDRDHTLEHFRQELWVPRTLDRQYYQGWMDGGALSMEDRCRQQKKKLLNVHQPEQLPADLESAFDEIVSAARLERVAA
jgi:trimethylamine--corrinoid protein Co-methyltransferase